MSTEHVVVPTEPCNAHDGYCERTRKGVYSDDEMCPGCVGGGRRALLDQAVPVEQVEVKALTPWWIGTAWLPEGWTPLRATEPFPIAWEVES